MTNPNALTLDEIETLRTIARKCYQQAYDSGWHKPPVDTVRSSKQVQILMDAGMSLLQANEVIKNSEFQLPGREFGTRLSLAHSELSEALEGYRKDLKDDKLPQYPNVVVELADCIIRIFDTAVFEGWDIAAALADKHNFNAVRADHKMENRVKVGGKKF